MKVTIFLVILLLALEAAILESNLTGAFRMAVSSLVILLILVLLIDGVQERDRENKEKKR